MSTVKYQNAQPGCQVCIEELSSHHPCYARHLAFSKPVMETKLRMSGLHRGAVLTQSFL